jgi:hypothetical protein
MLSGPGLLAALLDELAGRNLANRALLRSLGTLVHITTNAANPLHIDIPPKVFCFVLVYWLSPDIMITHIGRNETSFLKFFAEFLKFFCGPESARGMKR